MVGAFKKNGFFDNAFKKKGFFGQIWAPFGGLLKTTTQIESGVGKTAEGIGSGVQGLGNLFENPMYLLIGIAGVVIVVRMVRQ